MDKFLKIKSVFESHADPENAKKMSAYMRNLFEFYGIGSSIRKELCKELIRAEKKQKVVDWDFLDSCYEDVHREFQYFVLDYLQALSGLLVYDDIPKLTKYIKSKQWWDTIDFFDKILGGIGLKDKRVAELMLRWSTDSDIWLRRLAIDHQLGRKDKTDAELLQKIILNNLGSKEFFINKAIGWSLRDYSKSNPEWVRSFLDGHKAELSALSYKEASTYL